MILRPWFFGSVLAVSLGLTACGPTYMNAHVAKTIEQICRTEYHFQVAAKQVGNTVAVHLHHAGILQQTGSQVGLATSANETLANLIEVIHRVVLSADTPMSFYIVLVSDPAVSGAYLTLVRYVDDVRRANANSIPPTELFSRTIFELKYDATTPTLNLNELSLNEIHLGEFLSWQIARRIQTRLTETLQRTGLPASAVGQCTGEFQHGEFTFTLNMNPGLSDHADQATVQRVFDEATNVISSVLSGYRFKDFSTVRLTHPPSGRSLLLPRGRLEPLR